jgi:hypothetical protein
MENSMVMLEDEKAPITIDELADRMMAEGRKKSAKLFTDYKNEIVFKLSQSILGNEDKLKMINEEIIKLGLTFKRLKDLKSPVKIKQDEIEGLERVFGQRGERALYKHQYEIHLSAVASSFLTLKKKKYLDELAKELADLVEEYNDRPKKGEKIKFLGTPAQFAYMITSLMDKDLFEKVSLRSEGKSLRKIAKILYDTIYISDSTGTGETSFDNFYKEFRANSLTPAGREWITIRNIRK